MMPTWMSGTTDTDSQATTLVAFLPQDASLYVYRTGSTIIRFNSMRIFLTLLALLGTTSIQAEDSMSVEELEYQQQLNESMKIIDQIQMELEAKIDKRDLDCLKAFGHKKFCECIFDDMPVAWDFKQYIAITITPKEKLNYDKLDSEWKAAFDKVRPIRDKCVRQLNF